MSGDEAVLNPTEPTLCPRCRQLVGTEDSFCRHCGYGLRGQTDFGVGLHQTVVEALPWGVFLLDASCRVLYWSRAMEEQSGLKRRETLRKPLLDVLPQLAPHAHRIARVLDTAIALRLEQVPYETAQGGDVTEAYWFGPILLESGSPAILGLVEDITQKVRVDSNLIRSERLAAVGELAAGVAHNFNNILAAIGGDAQLLKLIAEEENLPAHVIDAAQQIHQETMRGGRIAHDLLSFARGADAQIQRLDVRDVIQDTVRLIRNHPAARGVEIDLGLREDLPQVEADANLLHQVFFNVMLNAIQALVNGGILSISATLRGSEHDPLSALMDIKFHDTGVGIPKEQLRRIFDPFYSKRANGTTGSGLGLPVSLSMVQSIGGDIHVTSAEGIGTTVTVSLPIVERRASPRKGVRPRPQGRVLLVDDDPNVRRTLATLFTRRGYEVATAEDGDEALKQFASAENERPFEVVLTELMLPKLDGFAVIREAAQRSPRPLTLVLTGVTDHRQLLVALDAGAHFGFSKPPHFGELVSVVEQLARPRQKEEGLQETCHIQTGAR